MTAPKDPKPTPTPPESTSAEISPSAKENEPAANGLSKEEQMARFEEELKENDWGHQPC